MVHRRVGRDEALAALSRLYHELDGMTGALHDAHASRLHCKPGCSGCCLDDLTVFEVEAWHIKENFPGLLSTGVPHPIGACAFLDGAGRCRIYRNRPYVCRTQGLPLRWLEELPDGSTVELRDICPVNDAGAPLSAFGQELCWSIGPFEERLSALQAAAGGLLRRVALRGLFRRSAACC
jgi:hypothetical protein